MSDAVHLPYAASFAPVWGRCSGAPGMAQHFPQEDTEDSRQGSAAHWYAEQRLRGAPVAEVAPNGVVLDDEMREGAMVYARDVQRAMSAASPGYVCQVETFGRAEIIHPDCGGTDDAFLYDAVRRLLVLWEFKYGHKEVSEFENLQLVVHVAKLLQRLGIDGHAEQSLTVEFRVVQPRCFTARGPVRSWRTSATALRPLYNMLRDQAVEAEQSPRTVSGPHCYYCPARHACEAARRAAMSAVDYVGRAVPEHLTPEGKSFELFTLRRAEQAIKARLAGLEEDVEATIRRGQPVPGFGLEPSWGRLAWLPGTTPEEIEMIGAAYGAQLVAKKPVTPAQARDLGVPDEMIDAFAHRPSGGARLKALDPDEIRRILTQQ